MYRPRAPSPPVASSLVKTLVASWFGTGFVLRRLRGSDEGSGTAGAAAALVIVLALQQLGWWVQVVAFVAVAGLSVWSTNDLHDPAAAKETDPGWVVVDEAAGMFLAAIGLGAVGAIVAFVVFRLADIFKNGFPGVAWAERLPGGWGVTGDDIVAGAYGLAAGWIVTGLL